MKVLNLANKKSIDKFTPAENRIRKTAPPVEKTRTPDIASTHKNKTITYPTTQTNDESVDESVKADAMRYYHEEMVRLADNLSEKIENKLAQYLSSLDKFESTSNNILTEVTKTSMYLPKIATNEQIKEVASNICNSINEKTFGKATNLNQNKFSNTNTQTKLDSIHEWSMINESLNNVDLFEGRPSIVLRQSVDDSIVDMLRSSEDTTWKTLDIIFHKVKENSENLQIIRDQITNIDVNLDSRNLMIQPDVNIRSPLVETMVHDSIEKLIGEIAMLPNVINDLLSTQSATSTNSQHIAVIHDDDGTSRLPGNSSTMNKPIKEAIAHTTNQKENSNPETLKNTRQMRLRPNSSGAGPGIGDANIVSTSMNGESISTTHQTNTDNQYISNTKQSELETMALQAITEIEIETCAADPELATVVQSKSKSKPSDSSDMDTYSQHGLNGATAMIELTAENSVNHQVTDAHSLSQYYSIDAPETTQALRAENHTMPLNREFHLSKFPTNVTTDITNTLQP